MNTCTTCTRPFDAPYRRLAADGSILEGCIDPCHTDHMQRLTDIAVETARQTKTLKIRLPATVIWHFREEAARYRVHLAVSKALLGTL